MNHWWSNVVLSLLLFFLLLHFVYHAICAWCCRELLHGLFELSDGGRIQTDGDVRGSVVVV